MRKAAAAFALALAACHDAPRDPTPGDHGAGEQLERAAIAAGMVSDPAHVDPVGAYASESDRVCILRAGRGYRIGASVEYGEGHRCLARGAASGKAGKLAVAFGEDCRFEAHLENGRLVFPPLLPGGCDALCTGRASLSALAADLLSGARSEAEALRAPDGQPLCN
ncbi:MAG: hypothetical protein QM688_14635 [Sphingomonas bacterium]